MGDILDNQPDRSFDFKEAESVDVPTIIPKMSDSEVLSAMRDVGLTKVNVRRWRAMEKVGMILERLGAVRVAMGEYVVSNNMRDEAIQKCRRFLNDATSPDVVAQLSVVMNQLITAKDSTTKQIIDAVKADLITKPETTIAIPSPGKRVRIVATEITDLVPPKQLTQ